LPTSARLLEWLIGITAAILGYLTHQSNLFRQSVPAEILLASFLSKT
jgi:hypothetical protein